MIFALVRLNGRLIRGGGAAGWTRIGLMLVGLAIGVAAAATAMSVPVVVHDRTQRAAERLPVRADDPTRATFRYEELDASLGDRPWLRMRLLLDPGSPLPPGVSRAPGPGETVASPAVVEAAEQSPELARSLGVIVAEISPAGLQGPDEAVSYTGALASDAESMTPAIVFGGSVTGVANRQSPTALAGELLFLIGAPCILFLAVCAQLSAATRARRLAALRLVGLSRRHLSFLAGLEGALTGAAGAVLGLAIHRVVAPALGRHAVLGIGWYPDDGRIGPALGTILALVVAVSAARLGSVGLRRVLADATAVRRGEPSTPSVASMLARSAPFIAGTSVLLVFAVISTLASARTYTSTTVTVITGATLLSVAGLLLLVDPACRVVAGQLADRVASVPIRLGARRLQYEPSGLIRIVTGLVLMVVVAGLGQALLRGASLAAGAEAATQVVNVDLTTVAASDRARLVALDARARVAAVTLAPVGTSTTPQPADGTGTDADSREDSSPGVGSGDMSSDGDAAAGPATTSLLYGSCADLEVLTGVHLPVCRPDTVFRLEDPDPTVPRNPHTPGEVLRVINADGAPEESVVGREVLRIPGLVQAGFFGSDALVMTSPAGPRGGWPADTGVTFLVGGTSEDLAAFRVALESVSPATSIMTSTRDVAALETYRVHRAAITLGIFIGFVLGLLTFLVAGIDRALERRRAVAALAVLGTPAKTLRGAQAVQLALPLLLGLGLAALVTHLAAEDYLTISDPLRGRSLTPLLSAAAMGALAITLGLASGLVVPGLHPRPEELRRE